MLTYVVRYSAGISQLLGPLCPATENVFNGSNEKEDFLISNFRRVLNVVYLLLGDSTASEFYMPTFRNTLFHLHRQVGACRMNSAGDMFGVLYGKRFGSEMA